STDLRGEKRTMKLTELPAPVIDKIRAYRWDRIIEKHEGPERWSSVLEYYDPEFIEVDGRHVLLPVERTQHPNITILRCIVASDEQTLVLFLKDTTYLTSTTPDDEMFRAGYLAICDRLAGEAFYIAVVYHEWFIIHNPSG
ncbi:MAG TPA: hypothetical protein VER55_03310, partial [Ardenticatenaceae bacterium]|nr:hypothetical protein [Ardenticatenaceae bacterium]